MAADTNRKQLSRDVISGEITGYIVNPDTGEKLETKFKDITDSEREELEELEEQAADGDEDAEATFEKRVINDYHLNDDFTVDNCGLALKQAILAGFMRSLGHNEATREAEEFFRQASQGNG